MKHTIVYKNKNKYASFPLLQFEMNTLTIGFFTAPRPDHMGLFEWKVMKSADNGETWNYRIFSDTPYDWPALSPRERSDRFTTTLPDGTEMTIGSYGFRIEGNIFNGSKTIVRSKELFLRSSTDNWKTIKEKTWGIPNADIVLTFPRHLQVNDLILVPAYIVLKNGLSRALVWRSDDCGENWKLYNMFPEICVNEMAFIQTDKGILAHIRSDKHPYIMESWSNDGIVWTYPTYTSLSGEPSRSIVGGPPHLLRLNDGRILETYSYRYGKMGIRAIVSNNEGNTWNNKIVLRDDGGYRSGLHERKWRNRFRLPNPGNDVGYPVSIQLDSNEILTAYYITNSDKVTHIAVTKWQIK